MNCSVAELQYWSVPLLTRHVDNFSSYLTLSSLSSTNKRAFSLSLFSCSDHVPSFSKEMVLIVAPSQTPISALPSVLYAQVETHWCSTLAPNELN
jgi:hypothetical protein